MVPIINDIFNGLKDFSDSYWFYVIILVIATVGFGEPQSWQIAAVLGLVGLIIIRHMPNIRRMRANEELAA